MAGRVLGTHQLLAEGYAFYTMLGSQVGTGRRRSDLTQRTVARLKPDKAYQFRVMAFNNKGCSRWAGSLAGGRLGVECDGGCLCGI